MKPPQPRFFFDYVDPLSYVVEERLRDVERDSGVEVARHPFEVVAPPDPLLDPCGEPWKERVRRAEDAARSEGLALVGHRLVPWSRKAHELVLHAEEVEAADPSRSGVGRRIHREIFRAFHEEGTDIGRVDVLVGIAVSAGLGRTETKAVLDVDRHLEGVRKLRREAERLEVRGVPSVLAGGRTTTGLVETDELREILAAR